MNIRTLILLSLLGALPAAAQPIDSTLTAARLLELCRETVSAPLGADAGLCVAYFRGFVDGAVVADMRVHRIHSGGDARESWQQRALRTRSTRQRTSGPATPRPAFCVDPSLGLSTLIATFIEHGPTVTNLLSLNAREAVRAVLQRHHSCE